MSRSLSVQMRRWSDEKLRKELIFADDNGGDPAAIAWCAALKAEAQRRGVPEAAE